MFTASQPSNDEYERLSEEFIVKYERIRVALEAGAADTQDREAIGQHAWYLYQRLEQHDSSTFEERYQIATWLKQLTALMTRYKYTLVTKSAAPPARATRETQPPVSTEEAIHTAEMDPDEHTFPQKSASNDPST